MAFCNLFTHRALSSFWELVEMSLWVLNWIGIWKCWFLRRKGNQSTWQKPRTAREKNQQQTQLIYGFNAGIQTQVMLVGGECSYHCATLACRHAHCSVLSFVLPFLTIMGLQMKWEFILFSFHVVIRVITQTSYPSNGEWLRLATVGWGKN